jgi:hypothetical protein
LPELCGNLDTAFWNVLVNGYPDMLRQRLPPPLHHMPKATNRSTRDFCRASIYLHDSWTLGRPERAWRIFSAVYGLASILRLVYLTAKHSVSLAATTQTLLDSWHNTLNLDRQRHSSVQSQKEMLSMETYYHVASIMNSASHEEGEMRFDKHIGSFRKNHFAFRVLPAPCPRGKRS